MKVPEPVVIAAAALVALGFILSTVGIFSAGWTENVGLFQACVSTCISYDLSVMPDYHKATAAMEILAFLASLACLACTGVFFVFLLLDKSNDFVGMMPLASLITAAVTGFFAILGVIIWGAKVFNSSTTPDYSYFLTIIGAIIIVIGGALTYTKRNSAKIGSA